MLNIFKKAGKLWNKVWFSKQTTEPAGIFRIALGIFVLIILLISIPNWERFYGAEGSLPTEEVPKAFEKVSWSIFTWSDSLVYLWGLYALAILASITFILGLFTRTSTIILFIIYSSMLHRNTYLVNGQDQIVTMLLFFSMFAPLGVSYSLDAFKKGLKPEQKSIWAIRLIQVSIAMVYLFSGPAKLFNGPKWRTGHAVYWISQSDRWFRFPDWGLFHNIPLSIILTYTTLLFFILFPYLVWFDRTRWIMLVGASFIHIGNMVVLASSVFWFNLIMLVAFILFIPPLTMRKAVGWSITQFRKPG